MKKLQFSEICKSFGSVVANDNISLSLGEGEILSLLGENGAGKTTLMNILFGHYVSDNGFIEVGGQKLTPGSTKASLDAGIGMVHQHFTLADNLTVLENIILGTEPLTRLWSQKKQAYKKLQELSKRFGLVINPDARVADLTVGEKQRVEIIKALYRDASILILDEPTAVLTPQESEQLFKVLKEMVKAGLSIMFISHKLNEILEISDRIIVLRHGKVVGEVATKNASKESLAEMMVGRKVTRPAYKKLKKGKAVVELNDVCLKANEGSTSLNNIHLKIHEKEIIGLAGVAGNGQAGLSSILQGLASPSSGDFRLFGESLNKYNPTFLTESGVARIPEDRSKEGVIGEMEIWENFLGEELRTKSKSGFFIDKKQAVSNAEKLIQDGHKAAAIHGDLSQNQRDLVMKAFRNNYGLVDLPKMVNGTTEFGQDVLVDGMVYASIERSPVIGAKVKSINKDEALKVKGVLDVVVMPEQTFPVVFKPLNGVAVIATNTWAALKGRKALKIQWDTAENENHDSEQYLAELSKNIEALALVNATRDIVDEVEKLLKNK